MFQRNHLLDFENFLKKCPTERPADRGISRPAGREQLADCGSSSVITFWTLSKFQNISKSAVEGKSCSRPAGRERPMRVSRTFSKNWQSQKEITGHRLIDRIFQRISPITFWTLSKFLDKILFQKVRNKCSRGKTADRRIFRPKNFRPKGCGRSRYARPAKRICRSRMFQRNHLLDFENFLKKCPTERPADRGISRLFQQEIFRKTKSNSLEDIGVFSASNLHLLDFVKISKYFKVRSGKRRSHDRGLSTMAGREWATRRLRIFQRNHLLDFVKILKYFKVRSGKRFAHRGLVPMLGPNGSADRGCSSVITFWTLKIF